jgi:peptide chain release factor 2
MMKPIIEKLSNLLEKVNLAISNIGLDKDQAVLNELEEKISDPNLWQDRENAERLTTRASELKKYISSWQDLAEDIKTGLELAELDEEGSEKDFIKQYDQLRQRADQLLMNLKFTDKYDDNSAIVQISAGVGGVDAMDWAKMLMEMYLKYAEKESLAADLVDVSYGEEAGIKSATLELSGKNAYGKFRSEKGVHRLVRKSPFNAKNLRQTSFALVDVVPEITEEKIDLNPDELKIDTFRSSGHGGQSVNTTDSAVRITHLPTGISVSIQNERSQLKNKQKALSILNSKLTQIAREQKLESISQIRGKVTSARWGDQIRSYVMHPYSLVKDHRTNYESKDLAKVLEGQITSFVDAYLIQSKN